jgi:hypothetical protein
MSEPIVSEYKSVSAGKRTRLRNTGAGLSLPPVKDTGFHICQPRAIKTPANRLRSRIAIVRHSRRALRRQSPGDGSRRLAAAGKRRA